MEPLHRILNLPKHLHLTDVVKTGQSLVIILQSKTRKATCPKCRMKSNRIHSHYWRTLQDLPLSQWSTVLRVQLVRFRCNYTNCDQKTFVEPLASCAQRYSRRTQRVRQLLTHIGFELGGQAGKRIATHYQIPTSRSTILRLIRGNPLFRSETIKVLGVDDWAMCRGERYGTILVDLERRRVVDLLPNTEAATFASWLRTQPQIQVVSRDRSLTYAEGAQQGAPQALQIADRWHLFKTLWDILVVTYTHHLTALKQLTVTLPSPPTTLDDHLPSVRSRARLSKSLTPIEQARLARRHHWEYIFAQVHQLRATKMSKSKIAKQLGISLSLVKKYCHLDQLPKKQSPKFKPLLIEPYLNFLRQQLLAGVRSTPVLFSALQPLGFTGTRSTVYKAIVQLRHELGLASPLLATKQELPEVVRLSPKRLATWVFAKTLSAPKQTLLQQARDLHPDIEMTIGLAHDFMYFVRNCQPQHLIPWIEAVELTELKALKQFARGLLRDFEAVYAACCSPWSNGQVEGQVNRLKFIKRQMYGRANFDLLRLRVLYSGPLCT